SDRDIAKKRQPSVLPVDLARVYPGLDQNDRLSLCTRKRGRKRPTTRRDQKRQVPSFPALAIRFIYDQWRCQIELFAIRNRLVICRCLMIICLLRHRLPFGWYICRLTL